MKCDEDKVKYLRKGSSEIIVYTKYYGEYILIDTEPYICSMGFQMSLGSTETLQFAGYYSWEKSHEGHCVLINDDGEIFEFSCTAEEQEDLEGLGLFDTVVEYTDTDGNISLEDIYFTFTLDGDYDDELTENLVYMGGEGNVCRFASQGYFETVPFGEFVDISCSSHQRAFFEHYFPEIFILTYSYADSELPVIISGESLKGFFMFVDDLVYKARQGDMCSFESLNGDITNMTCLDGLEEGFWRVYSITDRYEQEAPFIINAEKLR